MLPLWLLTALPLSGALVAWAVGRRSETAARWVALTVALAQCGLTAWLAVVAVAGPGLAWGAGSSASFLELSLDGLSVPLVALTALVSLAAVLASGQPKQRPGSYFGLLLLLQAAVTLVFIAADLLLFYAAWEAVLIPMFFLIGGWGHEDRRHAAMKFFLYTFAGSVLMLLGLLVVTLHAGTTSMATALAAPLPASAQALVFWLVVAGFAVKVPVFPLHTWLPDAHVEAPTAGSMLLAGVLLKMGGYGLLRIALPIAPEAARAAAPVLAALGIAGIVYGAMMALAQTDLKRLVAYSSVSHMGFVVLGVAIGTPLALAGAMLVMVAHGVVAPMLFFLVGSLYDRAHTRELARFGGLLRTVPAWGTAFVFACLASLGLPGLAGFPGELASFVEGYRAFGDWMLLALPGLVLAVAYNLRAVREVAHGPACEEWTGLEDLTMSEGLGLALLAVATVVLGVWPSIVSSPFTAAANTALAAIGGW